MKPTHAELVWLKRCSVCAAEVLEGHPWVRPCPFTPCHGTLQPEGGK
jgi:hypothetical protein